MQKIFHIQLYENVKGKWALNANSAPISSLYPTDVGFGLLPQSGSVLLIPAHCLIYSLRGRSMFSISTQCGGEGCDHRNSSDVSCHRNLNALACACLCGCSSNGRSSNSNRSDLTILGGHRHSMSIARSRLSDFSSNEWAAYCHCSDNATGSGDIHLDVVACA